VDVTELMEGLNLEEVLLAFSQELDALFVALNNHVSEDFVSLSLLLDLSILDFYDPVASLLLLFLLEGVSLNSKLGVKLAACL